MGLPTSGLENVHVYGTDVPSIASEASASTRQANLRSGNPVRTLSCYETVSDAMGDPMAPAWFACCGDLQAVMGCGRTMGSTHHAEMCILGGLTLESMCHTGNECLSWGCRQLIRTNGTIPVHRVCYLLLTAGDVAKGFKLSSLLALALGVGSPHTFYKHIEEIGLWLTDCSHPFAIDMPERRPLVPSLCRCIRLNSEGLCRWICSLDTGVCTPLHALILVMGDMQLLSAERLGVVKHWDGRWIRWVIKWAPVHAKDYVMEHCYRSRDAVASPEGKHFEEWQLDFAWKCNIRYDPKTAEHVARTGTLKVFKRIIASCEGWNPNACCRGALFNRRSGRAIVKHIRARYGEPTSSGFDMFEEYEGIPIWASDER